MPIDHVSAESVGPLVVAPALAHHPPVKSITPQCSDRALVTAKPCLVSAFAIFGHLSKFRVFSDVLTG